MQLSQFSAATQKHGLGFCLNAVPIDAGTFKQNVTLTTERGRWILRGRSHYSWQFSKERFLAELLGRETVAPVPLPYIVDESFDVFDFDYVLMPEMPGLKLSDRAAFDALSSSEQNTIALEQGRFLHNLQAYEHPVFGEYDEAADDIVGYGKPYSEVVKARASDMIELSNRASETIASAERRDILRGFDELAIDTVQPVFVMQDYKDGNMCVDKLDSQWRVTGLFDLMEGRFGHPLEDLPRQYATYLDSQRPGCAAAFLAGYGVTKEDIALFDLFMLIDRLIVWEFGVREGKDWFEGKSFLEWSEPYRLANSPLSI